MERCIRWHNDPMMTASSSKWSRSGRSSPSTPKLTGGVRVRTVVHENEEIVDEPLSTEQVEVARMPLDRWVETPIPVRQEGDTTIITLHEEVIVVEKRLRAIEEVHLIRECSTRSVPKRITLRREEAVIERLEAADEEDAA